MIGGLLVKQVLCKMALEHAFEREWANEFLELLDEHIGIDLLVKSSKVGDYDTCRFYRRLTMDLINRYPTISWNWKLICENSILTIDDVRKHPEKLNKWNLLSENQNFPMEDIMNNLDLPWIFDIIHEHRSISVKIIETYPSFDWKWMKLSIFWDDEGMEFISKNTDKPWNWERISRNGYLKYVTKYPNLPWDWDCLSDNGNITTEFIKQNLDKPWNWQIIANRWIGSARTHEVEHNIKRVLLLTMHEYHNNPTNYSFPMKKIEIILADDYLTKKLLNY